MANRVIGKPELAGETPRDFNSVPMPPPGIYKARIMQMEFVLSEKKNEMIRTTFELIMPPKLEQHAGFTCKSWHVATENGAGHINSLIYAISGGNEKAAEEAKAAFWGEKGFMLAGKDDKYGDVLRIGPLKINAPRNPMHVMVVMVPDSFKGREGNDIKTLKVKGYEPVRSSSRIDYDDIEDFDVEPIEEDDLIDDSKVDPDPWPEREREMEPEPEPEQNGNDPLLDMELKELRVFARDNHGLAPSETKGKTKEDIVGMINDKKHAAVNLDTEDIDDSEPPF